ncbi:MAG TPA: hypothetical protein VG838_16325 [Opitutaceae bacterium]|nr:hypothetical protein [Opitutaceae bacterium]
MASKKVDRALYGPSWAEVILGAALSFVLGAVLAAVVLVLRPVQTVRELPKEPVRDAVYYIEGSKDSTKGKQWLRKKELLNQGTSVALTEDELNAAFYVSPPPAPPKPPAPAPAPGAKGKAPATPPPAPEPAKADVATDAKSDALIAPGQPNFRIHDNLLQVGVPCTLNLYGFKVPVVVMATGSFAKGGDGVVFVPESYYLGSLAINRLPMVEGFVTRKILSAKPVPEDLATAWKKVTDATIEDKTLKLTL